MTPAHRRRVLLGLLVAAVFAQFVVLYAPAQPGGLPVFAHADKVVHVLVFLVPTALALVAGLPARVVVPAALRYLPKRGVAWHCSPLPMQASCSARPTAWRNSCAR